MNLTDKVSKYFTWQEVVESNIAARYGFSNEPPVTMHEEIIRTAKEFDTVRELLGKPCVPTSWYRCPEVNRLAGGSKNSDHLKGVAIDFRAMDLTPVEIVDKVAESDIKFDQLILEYPDGPRPWVHISFGTRYRKQVLVKEHGKEYYFWRGSKWDLPKENT